MTVRWPKAGQHLTARHGIPCNAPAAGTRCRAASLAKGKVGSVTGAACDTAFDADSAKQCLRDRQKPFALLCAHGVCQPIAPLYSCPGELSRPRRPAQVLSGQNDKKIQTRSGALFEAQSYSKVTPPGTE